MAKDGPSMSIAAQRLLAWLQAHACGRQRAATDAAIALAIGVSAREVIDLADELLLAGHVVVAEVTAPMGRWLLPVPPADMDLAAARRYSTSLGRRSVAIFRRRKRLRRAIAAAEARRPVESTGQMRLWTEPLNRRRVEAFRM